MTGQDMEALADERLCDWLKRSQQWYLAFYLLGGLSVVLTVTVASRPHFISSDPAVFADLAWAAAVFQGLSTFLIANRKATAYRAAWRVLWMARLRYVHGEKTADDAEHVERAILNGWATIDGGYIESDHRPSTSHRKRA